MDDSRQPARGRRDAAASAGPEDSPGLNGARRATFANPAIVAPRRPPLTIGAPMAEFNYFNFFTEIEEYFWRKRGAHLLVSPMDWAIMETWQKAGIPLAAVKRH